MISIVDYGLGNIAAFLNLYKRLNIQANVARSPEEVVLAERLILPGVGSFDNAMQRLRASGMCDALTARVVGEGVPVLGVCVGMQMFARSSDEGQEAGLGWIEGSVRSLEALMSSPRLPLPHMGWNDIEPVGGNGLFADFELDPRFYFLHSYYFECERPEDTAAVVDYSREFACAVRRDNVFGVQFHPEKSHHFGLHLLKNFAEV